MDKDESVKAQEPGTGVLTETESGTEGKETENKEQLSAIQKLMSSLFGGKDKAEETEPAPAGKGGTSEGGETSFTQADVDAAVRAAKEKWENEVAEAARFKKLSPEEREEEEAKKKEEELTTLRKKVLETELRGKAALVLTEAKLPDGLLDLLDYTSEENMKKGLDRLIPLYRASIEAGVKEKLRGKTPEGLGSSGGGENLLRAQIAKNVRGL